jgi:hypothetical protein
MSTPCNGRPAQEQQASTNIKAPVARKSLGVLEAVAPLRTWPMLARKVQQTQDNSRSPDVDQTIDFNPLREARKILCTTFGPFDPSKSIAAGNKGICKAANAIVGSHRPASMSPIGTNGHGGAVTACPLLGVERKTSARGEYFAF